MTREQLVWPRVLMSPPPANPTEGVEDGTNRKDMGRTVAVQAGECAEHFLVLLEEWQLMVIAVDTTEQFVVPVVTSAVKATQTRREDRTVIPVVAELIVLPLLGPRASPARSGKLSLRPRSRLELEHLVEVPIAQGSLVSVSRVRIHLLLNPVAVL